MGYRSIPNLYRPEATDAVFQNCKEVYALEKIHGTSAHIAWKRGEDIRLFSGGIKPQDFENLIEEKYGLDNLAFEIRSNLSKDRQEIIFYGEAYGGKCQRMSHVYGPLNFIVFEVKIDDEWLTVPLAHIWAEMIGLEFVWYERGLATLEFLDKCRDMPSQQAIRNGMGDDKIGEGIVVRSINEEIKDRFGQRIIAKHKRQEFRETKTPRKVNPEQKKVWAEARETAEEFVVMERLRHVLDKLIAEKDGFELSMKNTRTVIGAMIGDVRKEEGDDIEWSAQIQRAIGNRTANLYKEYLNQKMHEEVG